MEAGRLPPNWEDLVKGLSKTATTKGVNLPDTWFNGQSVVGTMDQLSYPFTIVNDHSKYREKDTPGSSYLSNNIHTSNSKGDNSPGNSSSPSQHKQMNNAAANLFASVGSFSSNMARVVSHTNTFGSNLAFSSITHDSEVESLQIPAILDLH